jgi:hypothetical protein
MTGEPMADETKQQTVTLQELMVSTLAMTDAAVKLLIYRKVSLLTTSSKPNWALSGPTISPC